jgi:protein-disulfide isomerase
MNAPHPRVVSSLLTLVLLALPACTTPDTSADISRLAARVDSLTVTVAEMRAAIQRGVPRARAETVTVATTGAAVLGRESAPVTIVEFTDYQCPFCARHARSTLPSLISEFVDRGRARYIIRDLPLDLHPLAFRSAEAARCASSQGARQYWQYHDALFDAQEHLADSSFVAIARNLGLDLPAFETCMRSPETKKRVEQDATAAASAGLTGTPSFVIGLATGGAVTGIVVRGAHPLAHFREVIEGALRLPSPSAGPALTTSSTQP